MPTTVIRHRNGNKTIIVNKPRRRGPKFHWHVTGWNNRRQKWYFIRSGGRYVCSFCGVR